MKGVKENIVLDYPVQILINDQLFAANSCEFFLDEHGKQWVKFIAKNGYQSGKDHMVRTEGIIIVVDSISEAGRAMLDSGEGK